MEAAVHLLLVTREADALLRMAQQLEGEGFIVHTATLSRDISTLMGRYPIRAVLIDQSFGETNAQSLLRRLHAKGGSALIATGEACSAQTRTAAFEEGADDFFDGTCSAKELAARIRAHIRRCSEAQDCAPGAVLQYGDLLLDTESLTLCKGRKSLSVTLAEYKLLVKLMRAPGKIFSKSELYEYINCPAADTVRDTLPSDDNTVMVHISKLRDKIEDDPRNPVYIKTVRNQGYAFDMP